MLVTVNEYEEVFIPIVLPSKWLRCGFSDWSMRISQPIWRVAKFRSCTTTLCVHWHFIEEYRHESPLKVAVTMSK